MWNMYGLQLAPRRASELQPVLMNTVLRRFATWPMARPEAEEISPMIMATLSRSMMRSALAEAVCGLTESSITSSILRPITPPPELTSSCASLTPSCAYSPSGPRKPRSEEHTSELQSHSDLVCRLLLEKKKRRYESTSTRHSSSPFMSG